MSEGIQQISNGFKLIGETILPGTSLLMDGRVKEGAAHMAVGIAARAFLGPIGWGIVAANSFSKSVSDQGLVGIAGDVVGSARNSLKREKDIIEGEATVEAEEEASADKKAAPAAKTAAAAK